MTDFERLRTSRPVDALAGRQLARGIEWVPAHRGNPDKWHWDAPPNHLLMPVPRNGHRGAFADLTGRKVGRLTVAGFLGKPNRKVKARWLVRCLCGDYEARSARAITNPANGDDCCEKCAYFARVKRGRGKGALPGDRPAPSAMETNL